MDAISNNANTTAVMWPPPPANVVTKSGPLFLSALFHWGCFGVLCTQFLLTKLVIYISGFPRDATRNKIFVYIVMSLEVTQTVILTKSYFDVFGYGFGDPESYDRVGAIWFSISFLSGTIACLTQMFYAIRLYRLSKSFRVPTVVSLLSITAAAGAIFNAIVLKDAVLFSRLPQKTFKASNLIWAGTSALCDVVIAYFMTRYLWKRRDEAMETTQIVVNRIVKRVLETGTVTALFAIILLVFTMLPDHISYYQIPAAILAKIYSNSMFALLNSRSGFTNGNGDVEGKPSVTTSRQLTVLRFVETYHDGGVPVRKSHTGDANSIDDQSVSAASEADKGGCEPH